MIGSVEQFLSLSTRLLPQKFVVIDQIPMARARLLVKMYVWAVEYLKGLGKVMAAELLQFWLRLWA
jgi:hypothetical protein